MNIFKTVAEMRSLRRNSVVSGKRIGFVPTMGALHEGHLSLVEKAKVHSDIVVMSIYVNPTQFNRGSDLESYPRMLEEDAEKAKGAGVDVIFAPSTEELYPNGVEKSERPRGCRVTAGHVGWDFEGAHRPGHFDGVTTVVSLLFNIIQPDCAVFGEKDYQQLMVIRQMVEDQHIPVEILGGELIRDADGIALSSRNLLLSAEGKTRALGLSRALRESKRSVEEGMSDSTVLIENAKKILTEAPVDKIDYVAIVDPNTLQPVTKLSGPAQMLLAAFVEDVRLLDNIRL